MHKSVHAPENMNTYELICVLLSNKSRTYEEGPNNSGVDLWLPFSSCCSLIIAVI